MSLTITAWRFFIQIVPAYAGDFFLPARGKDREPKYFGHIDRRRLAYLHLKKMREQGIELVYGGSSGTLVALADHP